MQENLKRLEEAIIKSESYEVYKKRAYLEPYFDTVYEAFHDNSFEDIPSLLKLSQLENKLTDRILKASQNRMPPSNKEKKEYVLEKILFYMRNQAEELYHCNLEIDSLRTRSKDFCLLFLEIAKGLEVPATMIDMGSLFHFPYSHYIVLCYLEEFYIADPTYQEFFLLGYNFKNRYYPHPTYLRTCEIGGRMLEGKESTAYQMIHDGYLKVNSKDFLNYCDVASSFGGIEPLRDSQKYLEKFMHEIERSSEKSDRILLSKMHNL